MLQLGSEIFDLLNAKQHVGNRRPVVYGKGGISASEVKNIEDQLGFRMPEDFAYLLQNIQDPGGVLFNWSSFSKNKYDEMMEWVWQGVEFDIGHNCFWLEKRWGAPPEDISERLDIAKQDFKNWPKLLPVYGHRFLAAEPCLAGNPVFSIMQTDIIYYGANLAHYLMQEFVVGESHATNTHQHNIRKIDVWSDVAEGTGYHPPPQFQSKNN